MMLHHGSGRHARGRNRALRYFDDPPVTEGGSYDDAGGGGVPASTA
jgi:hypothetical protein